MTRSSGAPDWCNYRELATYTNLADGTLVQIGGEHEDKYDPDFIVYNDVIIVRPDLDGNAKRSSGGFEIYGYPEDKFPNTDRHTATYIPSLNAILIVGNRSVATADRDTAKDGATQSIFSRLEAGR